MSDDFTPEFPLDSTNGYDPKDAGIKFPSADDEAALTEATLELTGAASVSFVSEDSAHSASYVAGWQAKQAGRKFTKSDYRATARHIQRLVMKGVPSLQVSAVHDAYSAMFQADSDATPVDGYPAFNQSAFTASCMAD